VTAALAALTQIAEVVREEGSDRAPSSSDITVAPLDVVSTEGLRFAADIESAIFELGAAESDTEAWDESRGARFTRLLVVLCELAKGEAAGSGDISHVERTGELVAEDMVGACGDVLAACLRHSAASVRRAAASALETAFFAEQQRKPDAVPPQALALVLCRVRKYAR
jgi:hypothetical protein